MIFAPITKVVAENTLSHYASRCCLGFTFASFLGNPLAGLAAIFFNWDIIFIVSGFILVLMGIMCLIFFPLCEKRDITHDFHIHTSLSFCAKESATIDAYVKIAKNIGLKKIGISNHFWDSKIPRIDTYYKTKYDVGFL